MVSAQPSWNEWLVFAYFLVLLFVFDTAQTAYSIAYASYILVAAPSKDERVDISVIGSYISNIGGFFGTIIPTLLLVGDTDKSITVLLFSGILILNAVIYWFAVRSIHDKAEMYKKVQPLDNHFFIDRDRNIDLIKHLSQQLKPTEECQSDQRRRSRPDG